MNRMMNGYNHYHNSVSGLSPPGKEKYQPNTNIKTQGINDVYTVVEDIGRGKFAVVRKLLHKETKEAVAAKYIKKRRRGKTCREDILREVVMLEKAISHPRLVQLKEVFETPTELILITEYCSGGELFHECVIEESFEEKDVVKIMRQILEGLDYLHQRNIVHLDIKPQNILLTQPFPKGDIKLCDLGFACLVNTGEDIRDIIGTVDYVAPEVLDYEPLGLHTDMWSLGVLAYVMLTAHSPFADDNQQKTFLNISQVNLEFPDSLFSHISKASQDFICKLLVKNPKMRMNTQQCLEHPWLTGVVSPESPLGGADSDSEDKMVESGDELEDNSEKIFETEIEVTKICSQSNDSILSDQREADIVLIKPESPDQDDNIPNKILKCNSNSSILEECDKEKNSENVTFNCSKIDCHTKDNCGIDDVNSNLSTHPVV